MAAQYSDVPKRHLQQLEQRYQMRKESIDSLLPDVIGTSRNKEYFILSYIILFLECIFFKVKRWYLVNQNILESMFIAAYLIVNSRLVSKYTMNKT